MERVARILGIAAIVVVGVALVATLAWAIATLAVRPLDGVEGDVLFEADRLRASLALYIDPARGAHDYGPVPTRYLVLYPPLWSALLSLVPRAASATIARASALASWVGLLGWIVARAPRERRRVAGAAAAFVAGVWVLALFAAAGRPDAFAVLLAGLALERATRRSSSGQGPRIDAVAGALFALAAWVKPNVIGMAPGAFAGALVASRTLREPLLRRVAAGAAAAAGVSAAASCVLSIATGRAWIDHLLASTGQPPSLALFVEQTTSRLPFFAALFGAAALAGASRARARDPGAAIALGALLSSVAWCVLSLAKIGSASNYFLEPCVASVVVLARAPLPSMPARGRVALAGAALAQALWTGTASVKSALEQIPLAGERASVLASARAACGAAPSDVVLADEPGLERMLDGRVVETPFQSTHLARRGKFPVAAWIDDVSRPEVRCLVMQDDLLERPLDVVSVAHDRFGPELRRVLRAEFELVARRGGFFVYRRRGRVDEP